MNDNQLTKMSGYVVPFQMKGGGGYNLSFLTRHNPVANIKYLGGILIVTNLGVDGMNIQRTASITLDGNPQWETIKNACQSYYKNREPISKYLINDDNAVKVLFDFAGIEDNFVAATRDESGNVIKKEVNYVNIHVKNIELVENKSFVADVTDDDVVLSESSSLL